MMMSKTRAQNSTKPPRVRDLSSSRPWFKVGFSRFRQEPPTGVAVNVLALITLKGTDSDEFLALGKDNALNIGFYLLGPTEDSAVIFEGRAVIIAVADDKLSLTVNMTIPGEMFATERERLLYVNCVVEGAYWFHDKGNDGAYWTVYL